jgi:hypothetical protein
MAHVPVFCDNCGTLFVTSSLIGGDVRVTFENTGFGPCPGCGGMGRVLDGSYEFIGDTIKVLGAPAWSHEKLTWLEERIRAAQAGAESTDDVIEDITEHAPELAELFRSLLKKGWTGLQVLVAILAVVTYLQSREDPPATSTQIEHVDQVLERLEHQPLASSQQSPHHPKAASKPRARPVDRARKRRPAKTYGRNKKRRR